MGVSEKGGLTRVNRNVKRGDLVVVWFSCGAASAVAAKKSVERWGGYADVRVVNNPVAEEHPDNRRFLEDYGS